jgi:ABC-type antimicrobial peptide transport system permease subunit
MGSYLAMQMNQMEKRTQEIQLFQEWGWQTKRWLQLYLMEELLIAIAAVGIGIGGGYGLIYALAQTKVISVTSLILFSITTILFALVALIFTLSTRSKQTRLREFN